MENPKNPQADSALTIKQRNPIEVEYTRLLAKYRHMDELLYKADRDRSWYRIALSLLGTFMVYLAWACEWVNNKFLIAVSAICIAVVAATLGSLWEKRHRRGGESE